MVTHARTPCVSPEEYLIRERAAETKSEYHDGVIVARAGATWQHTRIAANLLRHLGNQLAESACEPFSSDMRVRVPEYNRYYYPDVSVVCGEAMFEDSYADILLNPRVVIEILSSSTEKFDRTDKYDCYRTLTSLTSYVLVAQDRPRIEVLSRQADGSWRLDVVNDMTATLTLFAIVCELKLTDIYARVEFVLSTEQNVELA